MTLIWRTADRPPGQRLIITWRPTCTLLINFFKIPSKNQDPSPPPDDPHLADGRPPARTTSDHHVATGRPADDPDLANDRPPGTKSDGHVETCRPPDDPHLAAGRPPDDAHLDLKKQPVKYITTWQCLFVICLLFV